MKVINIYLAIDIFLLLHSCNLKNNFNTLEGSESLNSINKGGTRNGREIIYYNNGEIETISYWKNDSLHGQYLEFYEDGLLKFEMNLRNGNPYGSMVDYHENGGISKIVQIYKRGEVTIHNQVIQFDDEGNVIEDSSHFFIIKSKSDTIRLGEDFVTTIEVVNPKYDKTLVTLGNYNDSINLKDSTNFSVFSSEKPKVPYNSNLHKKGNT